MKWEEPCNRSWLQMKPVESEKYIQLKFKTSGKLIHHFRGMVGIYLTILHEKYERSPTWKQRDLETLGSWPIMPKNLPPAHWDTIHLLISIILTYILQSAVSRRRHVLTAHPAFETFWVQLLRHPMHATLGSHLRSVCLCVCVYTDIYIYIYEAPCASGESIWGHFSRVGRPINRCRNQSSRSEWQGERGAMRGVWKLRIRLS